MRAQVSTGRPSTGVSTRPISSIARIIEKYGEDHLPAGNRIQDWPITYDEIEPFYDAVDYDIGVSGKAGNLNGEQIEGGNVFEGPRSANTRCHRSSAGRQQVSPDASDLGYLPPTGRHPLRVV